MAFSKLNDDVPDGDGMFRLWGIIKWVWEAAGAGVAVPELEGHDGVVRP